LIRKLAILGKCIIIALALFYVVMTANTYLSGGSLIYRLGIFSITFLPSAAVIVFILAFWNKPIAITGLALVLAIAFSIISFGFNEYPESLYGFLMEVVPLLFTAIVHLLSHKETRNKT
jgi:peptidoglycan/LPS O-acetylase OafA/YrhL